MTADNGTMNQKELGRPLSFCLKLDRELGSILVVWSRSKKRSTGGLFNRDCRGLRHRRDGWGCNKALRSRVFIATKVSPAHFRRSDVLMAADKSLERLRTDCIDLYQLHRPNYTVPIEETMGAMEELVDAGKIRFIGVSNFSVGEVRKAQAALSRYRVVSNQICYNLVERSVELGLLRYCREKQDYCNCV
jgi:hypothetical protein